QSTPRPLLDGTLAGMFGGAVERRERLDRRALLGAGGAVRRAAAEIGHGGDGEEPSDAELVGQGGHVLAPLDVRLAHPLWRTRRVEVRRRVDHPIGAG